MTSDDYIEHIIALANKKLEENFKRINRFEENIKVILSGLSQTDCATVENNTTRVYRRKRNRDRSPKEKRLNTNESLYSCSSLFLTGDDI